MKFLSKILKWIKGFTDAITRFPLTFIFLIFAAITNALAIESSNDYSKIILTLAVGAFLFIVAQIIYERFLNTALYRYSLMLAALLLTGGYYLSLLLASNISFETGLKTFVALFALLIAFIYVPSIKEKTDFNSVFMAVFKSFFISAFFSLIIWGGVSLILLAINNLLFTIKNTANIHAANIIFVIFAPMYLLSLVPIFTDKEEDKEDIEKASSCPKFLEILISYILMPITAVYTLVLVSYIIKTIVTVKAFWTDNMLEPLILTFSAAVILLYILSGNLTNRFARFFKMIFPKVLVFIVLFQLVSTIINIFTGGFVIGRYYVFLFGIYSVITGILFSILPVKKNGIAAALVIAFALISIIPPVDAFTVSKTSQISILENTLKKDGMLKDNTVTPNASIPDKDKNTIRNSIQNINEMGYIKQIKWLPNNFEMNDYATDIVISDFKNLFGFSYDENAPNNNNLKNVGIYLTLDPCGLLNINGYDFMFTKSFNIPNTSEDNLVSFIKAGKNYSLLQTITNDDCIYKVVSSNSKEIISFSLKPAFDEFLNLNSDKKLLTPEEATFTNENGSAKISVVFKTININSLNNTINAEVLILISIK